MFKKIRLQILPFLLLTAILSIFISCGSNRLQNGDLLFVTAQNGGLSGAISAVTKIEERSYDHLGLVEKQGKNYFVLHAAPSGGSQRQALQEFALAESKNSRIDVYRLKKEFRQAIPLALINAKSMLGKAYNSDYILNDNSYYCSDFVQRAFRPYGIFKLEPMTFKDAKTGETNSFWQGYYQRRNLPVPEGKLGCNPNGLAASDKIQFVKTLSLKHSTP